MIPRLEAEGVTYGNSKTVPTGNGRRPDDSEPAEAKQGHYDLDQHLSVVENERVHSCAQSMKGCIP